MDFTIAYRLSPINLRYTPHHAPEAPSLFWREGAFRYNALMSAIEVEIKSLLGSSEKADVLRLRIFELDPEAKLISKNRQLNHYFTGGSLMALAESARHNCLSEKKCVELHGLAKRAKDFSVRTRLSASGANGQAEEKDGEIFLVVKASVDDTTSSNGISRIEFEEKVDIPLGTLDALILGSGFLYQAKWSREREEYAVRSVQICLDKNAGYGWLAEFEKMVADEGVIESTRRELRALMRELGVEELPQERLERMFSFYNAHWEEYYGTDKTFTVA